MFFLSWRWVCMLPGPRPNAIGSERLISKPLFRRLVIVLSGLLASAVSILLTVQDPLVTPDYGVQVTIFALVGVVVGGLDRLLSATLGGFAIGFATSFVGDRLPTSSTQFLPSVIYGLVIVVLLLRPSGVFAPFRRAAVERV